MPPVRASSCCISRTITRFVEIAVRAFNILLSYCIREITTRTALGFTAPISSMSTSTFFTPCPNCSKSFGRW